MINVNNIIRNILSNILKTTTKIKKIKSKTYENFEEVRQIFDEVLKICKNNIIGINFISYLSRNSLNNKDKIYIINNIYYIFIPIMYDLIFIAYNNNDKTFILYKYKYKKQNYKITEYINTKNNKYLYLDNYFNDEYCNNLYIKHNKYFMFMFKFVKVKKLNINIKCVFLYKNIQNNKIRDQRYWIGDNYYSDGFNIILNLYYINYKLLYKKNINRTIKITPEFCYYYYNILHYSNNINLILF